MLLITIALCILVAVDGGRLRSRHRIVHGNDAKKGHYPYIVSMRVLGEQKCGGSIISPIWILTAAHCIKDFRAVEDFSIQYGVITVAEEGPNVVQLEEIIKHPYYNDKTHENDIALLKLAKPLEYNEFVQPIPLAEKPSQSKDGDPCTLVGWGRLANESKAKHLQELHYNIVGTDVCANLHSKRVFQSNICAAYPGYTKAQCGGDSGGPLTVHGVQVGIVSWSKKPCGVVPLPAVFTLVAYFRDWIFKNAGV